MSADHYFSAQPSSPQDIAEITLELAGEPAIVRVGSGVFASRKLDQGTRILLDHAPRPAPDGVALDLGCGWGPIAITLARLAPAARVIAVDVNERARMLTAHNAQALGLTRIEVSAPEAVDPDQSFDLIWSNPPIRIGKPALHELLGRWLPRLRPDGAAYLVVSKHLGADSLQRWITDELGLPTQRYASSKGFRVLEVRQP